MEEQPLRCFRKRSRNTKGEPCDLVCLDIMMPVFNGHQTLQEMRQIEKEHQVPDEKHSIIIMMTALANQQTVVEALEESCDSYIAKPVRKNVL
ncbi:MAG: PleD family two-component system response regulator, partial [Fidelibacterota bacterium]